MKRDSKELIQIPCECGKFKEMAVGTKKATCDHCQRGMEITWAEPEVEITGNTFESEGVEKHYGGDYEVSYYQPFGGATSFEEVDAFREAQDTQFAISSAKFMFDSIYDNIWADKETTPDQKVSATETAMKEMIQRMQNPEDDKSLSLGDRLKSLIGLGKSSESEPSHRSNYLLVTKDTEGNLRWLTLFTNKFEDREKEIFSADAHVEYEAWVDRSKQYPSLRVWHMPGTDLGKADVVTYADGFMLASGTFYEKSLDVAEKLAGMSDLGVSHGYIYRDEDLIDGVYTHYRTFEISVLPMEAAANSWTAFTLESLQKEVAMGIDETKRTFFVDLLGEERVKVLEEALPQLNKDLENAGVAWKDLTEALSGDGEGEGEEKTEETPKDEEKKEEVSEGESEGDEKKEPAAVGALDDKALDAIKAALTPILEPLAGAVKEIQEKVAELEKTDDEKVAAKMQQAKQTANGKKASESDKNVVDGDKLDQADKDTKPSGQVAAAQDIVNELLLGQKPVTHNVAGNQRS